MLRTQLLSQLSSHAIFEVGAINFLANMYFIVGENNITWFSFYLAKLGSLSFDYFMDWFFPHFVSIYVFLHWLKFPL